MKSKLFLTAFALAALPNIDFHLSTAHAQGVLTPPAGAPVPVMKTLDQVEARTAITNTSSLVTISQPGSYYLTGNLTVSTGNGINITTNNVRLDLNGFTIRSTATSAAGYGILLSSGLKDLTILNGFIQGGVTNNGSGIYNGGGFSHGINFLSVAPLNMLVSHISVSGCGSRGIYLGLGDSTVVEACTVRAVGGYGINASTIRGCSAVDCGAHAIWGDQVSDCRGENTSNGGGIFATSAQNCSGFSNTGTGLDAISALNCYGQSNIGIGLSAATAQNCNGTSYGNSYGLLAVKTATGCCGSSSSGTGLQAFIATSCSGSSSSGTALNVTHSLNSF